MTIHTVYAVGFSTEDPATVFAPAGLNQELDALTVPDGEFVALIAGIDPVMGLTFSNLSLVEGDLVTVTGPAGEIPDYQIGLTLVADQAGVAHFPNAGHLAAAFTLAQT